MAMGPEAMDHAAMDHDAMQHDISEDAAPSFATGTVAVIDLDSGEIVKMIPVGTNATGLGVRALR
jgi:hypothetical protein